MGVEETWSQNVTHGTNEMIPFVNDWQHIE